MTLAPEQLEALARLRADYDPDSPEEQVSDLDTLPPAPAWPAGVLPSEAERYVTAQARSIGVPVDMVAVPLLVAAGGTIGHAVQLELKPTWAVLPSLWAGLIAPPGWKKSPAMRAALWPLHTLQTRLYDSWRADLARFEADMQAWDAKPKAERGDRPEPPHLDHLLTTDVTVEALVDMLSRCRGLTITVDELTGFIASFDRYRGGKGGDRQQYLSLWAGTPIKADRKGGGTIYAAHPVAGVYGGIQPDYASTLHNRNGDRDGMVERFLLYRPDVVRSGWTDDTVDPALLDPVADLFAALRAITPPDDAERITVKLHPEARRRFIDWYNANDAATEQASGLRQGFYAKLDSQTARIALTLHCLHNPNDPRPMVSDATMQAAIDVAEFFRAHLDRVLPLIGDHTNTEPAGLAGRILRYLRLPELHDPDGWVRRSDLYNRLRNVPSGALSVELADLRERGAVESRTVKTATRPAEQWRIASQNHSSVSDDSEDSTPRVTDTPKNQNPKNGSATPSGPDLHRCQRCGGDLPDDRDALCHGCGDADADMAYTHIAEARP